MSAGWTVMDATCRSREAPGGPEAKVLLLCECVCGSAGGRGGCLCLTQADAASPVATLSPVISRLVLVPESGATYSLSLFSTGHYIAPPPPPLLSPHHSHHLVLHPSHLLTLSSSFLAVKTSRDKQTDTQTDRQEGGDVNVNVLVNSKMLKLTKETSCKVIE